MFRGSSVHTIDSKGRIIIPARFRNLIKTGNSNSLMVSGLDKCLVAYPIEEWHKVESKILSLVEKSDTMRRFRRVFIGGASECPCDKQDRVLIPPLLRKYADFKKEIALVGVLTHFEIWCREKWEKENMAMEKDMKNEEVRKEIAGLGL
ncbi:MAG: division/cell wall cluster transcriptional repressor MraZ [Thermodesulfobacteriota bacterium]|nr:division/cell wall cluster transcriptional repressor MraZ [Thermodesulfobacteriota bacterium]